MPGWCLDVTIGRVLMKVLIVDDHPDFRSQVRSLLVSAGYDVVGEAKDGRSALVAIDKLGPDILLLDVQLPDTTGFDLAESLRGDPDPPAVILVSSREASDYGGRIIRSGARGFVSKSELTAAALARIIERSS
jgi:DNA-binding NarL/FixJ family response regulator